MRTTSRHRFPTLLALTAGAGLALLLTARAQPGPEAPARAPKAEAPERPLTELKVVERVNEATDKALDYLEKVQIKDGGPHDGAWNASNNAINALAVLAFLSRGHVPGRGKYGDTIEGGVVKPGVLTRAKRFIVSTSSKVPGREGYLSLGGTMYEHGLTTLALAELYGMSGDDPDLESALRNAVTLILRAQGTVRPAGKPAEGGWNYQPTAVNGDLSVSVMQIVAMRAANNAGIPVPKEAIDRAIAYVRAKANPSGGGFGYGGPGAGPSTSAAGVLSLQLLGQPQDPQVPKTLDYLAPLKIEWNGTAGGGYFYYFHYYAVQAFYQAGGKNWDEWHPRVRELLLEKQNKKEGSWDVPPGLGEASYVSEKSKVYSTAIATLVLNIYMHYLPAYQR